jgi:hypothetical protein
VVGSQTDKQADRLGCHTHSLCCLALCKRRDIRMSCLYFPLSSPVYGHNQHIQSTLHIYCCGLVPVRFCWVARRWERGGVVVVGGSREWGEEGSYLRGIIFITYHSSSSIILVSGYLSCMWTDSFFYFLQTIYTRISRLTLTFWERLRFKAR